jgi:4-oxalocrotonate tautomerase
VPFIHINLRGGKPAAYRQAIFDSLYRAMREALGVPEDDQFMTITEHDGANFRYGNAFGVIRNDDLVYIQITVFDTRTAGQKKALYKRTAELLGNNPGIRPENVFVQVLDAAKGKLVGRPRPCAICVSEAQLPLSSFRGARSASPESIRRGGSCRRKLVDDFLRKRSACGYGFRARAPHAPE